MPRRAFSPVRQALTSFSSQTGRPISSRRALTRSTFSQPIWSDFTTTPASGSTMPAQDTPSAHTHFQSLTV